MAAPTTPKLADPAWRRERAQKAAAARTSVDYYIRKLVENAPPLSATQRARLAAILLRGQEGSAA